MSLYVICFKFKIVVDHLVCSIDSAEIQFTTEQNKINVNETCDLFQKKMLVVR